VYGVCQARVTTFYQLSTLCSRSTISIKRKKASSQKRRTEKAMRAALALKLTVTVTTLSLANLVVGRAHAGGNGSCNISLQTQTICQATAAKHPMILEHPMPGASTSTKQRKDQEAKIYTSVCNHSLIYFND
jgi:hypothetical protein